ncbi:hypothetical protein [Fimbriiglobus ruber]|uniref:Uncharacterized protein n=1 Tax=Fimbriiglobus ruber TaxID=1908690 RepID=A0A225DK33_9BACT|nr:hypothetical protein [Fimbriiglobus ruber]OWK37559.1 hypothetical protein FRUB_06679 [Fimbriiglobus ruber]
MRRLLMTAAAALFVGGAGFAADKGTTVELAGLKSTTPADWKEETPSNAMRMAQFKLPKAEGDADDAELAVFVFPGGSGTVKQNLDRQLAKFVEEGRKEKSDKIKVGEIEAAYQDVSGTFKKKKFPMAQDFTPVTGFRQLYVVFEGKDNKQYYMTLLGPIKTVEKHKKGFEEWLKNFK